MALAYPSVKLVTVTPDGYLYVPAADSTTRRIQSLPYGLRLLHFRKSRGLTWSQIARRIGVTSGRLSAHLRGSAPSTPIGRRILKFMREKGA